MNPLWQFSLNYFHAVLWLGSLVLALVWGVRTRSPKHLVAFTLAITFGLIVLGAYVRLSDAGLGCPDWPGCYGQLTPLQAHGAIQQAHTQAPNGPVSLPKAWKEMIHRYIASLVGALILAILWQGLRHTIGHRQRRLFNPSQPQLGWRLPLLLLLVVILQGLFGKWTVTLLLKPAIVTGHLLGGMAVLALLTWQYQRLREHHFGQQLQAVAQLSGWAKLALVCLVIQIAFGAWVSTNYAASVCGDLPTCQQSWFPATDFGQGFQLTRELGKTADGQYLSLSALTAIHLTHRFFALVVVGVVGWLAWRARRIALLKSLGTALIATLLLQVILGLSVVYSMANQHLHLIWQLPLAAAHNAGAALLLVLLLTLNYKCALAARE